MDHLNYLYRKDMNKTCKNCNNSFCIKVENFLKFLSFTGVSKNKKI